MRILGRILSGSWVGSNQDPVGSYQNASGYYRSFSVSSHMQSWLPGRNSLLNSFNRTLQDSLFKDPAVYLGNI